MITCPCLSWQVAKLGCESQLSYSNPYGPATVISSLTSGSRAVQSRQSQPSLIPASSPHPSSTPYIHICSSHLSHIHSLSPSYQRKERSPQALSLALPGRMGSPPLAPVPGASSPGFALRHPYLSALLTDRDIGSPLGGRVWVWGGVFRQLKGTCVGVHLATLSPCPGARAPSPLVHRATQRPLPFRGCSEAQ